MTRATRNALLLVVAAILLARVPYAATNMDGARDMFTAWRLLHGEAIPLTGPILAGTIHLGPIWFFLLAGLLAVGGGNWLATTMLVAILAAAQVPLAYLAGKAIHSRRAGIYWACALVLPSWASFEALLPSHPQMIAASMLAFILCAARFWRRPRRRYLFGMALAFVLALHAHPCSVCLVWIGALVVARAWRRNELRAVDLIVSALIVLAPLLPFIYSDASRGFAELGAARAFVGNSDFASNLAGAWPLFSANLLDGASYWFGTMLAWPRLGAGIATVLVLSGYALALVGMLRLTGTRETRGLGLLALAFLAAAVLTTALLRGSTPFYMTIPIQVALAGLFGIGLAALGDTHRIRAARSTALAIVLIAGVAVDVGIARVQTRGAWPFAWWPIMDVKQALAPTHPLMLMPAYAMRASGQFLCGNSPLAIHGSYASMLLQNYAIEMRLECGNRDLQLGGSAPEREHWLGMSRAMFARLDIDPQFRLGPVGLVRARALAFGVAIPIQHEPHYPAYQAQLGPVVQRSVSIPLAANQHVAVSDLAFAFDIGYEVTANVDGRPLTPRAEDSVTRVYACEGCAPGSNATLELTLGSGNLADVDLVVF